MCTIDASQMPQYAGTCSRPVCSPACRKPASFRWNDTELSWWTWAVSVCSLIICQSYKNNKIFYFKSESNHILSYLTKFSYSQSVVLTLHVTDFLLTKLPGHILQIHYMYLIYICIKLIQI